MSLKHSGKNRLGENTVRKASLDEIKALELNILLLFDQYCKKNKLVYYLAGGTLLGAIRHKGFIPWDDDIDVCMPRKDYITFFNSFHCLNNRYMARCNLIGNFTGAFGKLVDLNTHIENIYTKDDRSANVWIDIFPVDGLPEDLAEVKKIYKKCSYYRRILRLADSRLGEGKTTLHKCSKYILKPLAQLYGKKRCVNNIETIAALYPYETSTYVGIVTNGLYGIGERMIKSEFEQSTTVTFEHHNFPAFSCWDSYLTGIYGDYMQLPPIEKRKIHDMKVYIND